MIERIYLWRVLFSSSNRSINLFNCCHIFFRGCVPDVVVPPYAVGFIYIPGKLGFVSLITVQFYDVFKLSNTLWPDGLIRLFVLWAISLSSLCRCIWGYWTFKLLNAQCRSKIKPILSIIFNVIYGDSYTYIQHTYFSFDDCEHFILSSSNRKYDPFAIV